jgi:hypothetical protein
MNKIIEIPNTKRFIFNLNGLADFKVNKDLPLIGDLR